jgi:hypothetical protein
MLDSSPMKTPSKARPDESASDVDFATGESEGDDDSDGMEEVTPPRGKTSPKKVTSSQPSSAIKNSTPVKKQQVPASKINPTKPMQTSSRKIVGSKKSEAVKASKVPDRVQNDSKDKPINPAKSSADVKQKALVAGVAVDKAANGMQVKKLEAAVKQSAPSPSSIAKQTNIKSPKSKGLVLSEKRPAARSKTASAGKKTKASHSAHLVSATANQLKSTQQLANAPSQSFNNHHQEIAHLPCATPKTNPVNESLKSNPA